MSFRSFLKRGISFVCIASAFAAPSLADAWNQLPHSRINAEAISLFVGKAEERSRSGDASAGEKYRLGPLADGALRQKLRGVAVDSSSLFSSGFVSKEASLSMQRWIIMGGDWADEPHLYSSVRHFYDPLRIEGVAHLTDQSWAKSISHLLDRGRAEEIPRIDARSWGVDNPENPFSLFKALASYKAAMEVRDDQALRPLYVASHFKTTLDLVPLDHEDQRALFLSRAYRALGESMHMLGDMTQPAHVRNDAHAMDEPIEVAVFDEHVRRAAANPFVDSRIRPYLASAGGTLQDPLELFHQVALFTNSTFYSMDTIYDGPSGVFPNNIDLLDILEGRRKAYPSPQFHNLEERKATVRGFLMPRTVKKYYGVFDGVKRVPMAQERLSFHWFDPEQSFFGGFDKLKEKGVRGLTGAVGRLGRYHVPHAFGPPQAEVLLPLAIHACADLMDLFFPTLELKAEFAASESPPEGDPDGVPVTVVEIVSPMKHHRERDPAWNAFDLTIRYSGPADLVIQEKGKDVYVRKLHFVEGVLEKIETLAGTSEKAPLRLFAARSGVSLTEEQAFYEIKHDQTVFVRIEAGSRLFESPSWTLKQEAKVSVLPPRILILELQGGANEAKHEFEAVATPKGSYVFEWNFDDGSKTVEDRPRPDETSTAAHTYKELKEGDAFFPSVKLFDDKRNLLAEDTVSVKVTEEAATAVKPSREGAGWVLTDRRKQFNFKEGVIENKRGGPWWRYEISVSDGSVQVRATEVPNNKSSWVRGLVAAFRHTWSPAEPPSILPEDGGIPVRFSTGDVGCSSGSGADWYTSASTVFTSADSWYRNPRAEQSAIAVFGTGIHASKHEPSSVRSNEIKPPSRDRLRATRQQRGMLPKWIVFIRLRNPAGEYLEEWEYTHFESEKPQEEPRQ